MFLGAIPAIILVSINLARSQIAMTLAVLSIKKVWGWIASVLLAIALITANLFLWENWLNIVSIVVGLGFILAYVIFERPRNTRLTIVVVRSLALTFFIVLVSPINAAIELVGIIAAIVGLVRLDFKRKDLSSESQ